MLDLVVVISASVVNFLLGSLVYLRNPSGTINKLFGAFSISVVLWSLTNYFADAAPSANLLFTRLAFVFAALAALFVYIFSNYFPSGRPINSQAVRNAEKILVLGVVMLSLSPLLVPGVTKVAHGVELHLGPLYFVYLVFLAQFMVLVPYNFIKRYKHSGKQEKTQIKLLLIGFLSYAVLGAAANLVLPLFLDSWSTSRFGPIFTLLFVAITAYAIVKHGLLNIRLIVARSIAYVMTIGVLVLGYGVISSMLIQNLLKEHENTALSVGVNTAVFVVGVLLYPRLKQFFDKITNELFYRDAYDPQSFLDELNSTIVSNIELGILSRHTAKVINDNIKSEFCLVGVHGNESRPWRLMGTDPERIDSDEINFLREKLPPLRRKIIVTDELEEGHSSLKKVLHSNNIAVIVSLKASDSEEEPTAYLILGSKLSGNIYSKQDLRIINIIADELLIAIQNALRFEEIQEFNVTLQQKINDATAKLKRTNEKLKELDSTKDEFISMASHQLRTPLTSVKGYVSMVLEGDAGPLNDMQKKLLDQAFVSSQRMVYLIADLLNVSRLKTGKFIIEGKPTNLADVVEGEIEQLKQVAKGKQLTLTYDKPAKFPLIMLDETKTRQVIMNFADNAIYYTPSGGNVKVELKSDKGNVYFMVRDDGLGVPEEEKAHLFTKFYRAKNARKARPDGTGLGLFMAKKVINAQGGTILFESTEGKGSMFGFEFKRSSDHAKT